MLQKTIKILIFIFIFCILLKLTTNVLRIKDDIGIYQLDTFYREKDNIIDVLMIGSSHIYVNLNAYYLYKYHGIAGFDLAGGAQPIWNTYYYLKEALKTQTPKLIIFDPYMLWLDRDYFDDWTKIGSTYGLKWSFDRINAIKVSVEKNRWNNFLNSFVQYHNRYLSLNKSDFLPYKGNEYNYKYWKGFVTFRDRTNQINYLNIDNITNVRKLYPKVEKYFRMTLELAQKNNIQMLMLKTPSGTTIFSQELYNEAALIAKEYNVDFLNLTLSKYIELCNLDYTNDFWDGGHLNSVGAEKVAKYVGKYIIENYNIPDRRGDPKYYSWEMNAKYQDKEIYNFELKQYTNIYEYIKKVKNTNDYIIGITMLGDYKKDDFVVKNIITNFNINEMYLENDSYVIDNNKLIYSSHGSNQYLFYKEIGNYTDLVLDSGRKLSINRTNYIKTTNGINILIYDKFTEEIVDNIYLEYKENSIDATIKR